MEEEPRRVSLRLAVPTFRLSFGRKWLLRRGWPAFLALYAIAFWGWLLIKPFGDEGLTWFSDITLTVTALSGGLVSLLVAWRMKGSDRRSWLFIGAGIVSWGLGQLVWSYYELVLKRDTPFPSFADLGYLGMIPLVFAGLISLPGAPVRSEERIKIGLDAVIVMTGLATVAWFAVLGPIYAQADAGWLEKLIGLAYPAGDVMLMCALIGGFARGWISRRNPIVALLIIGIALFIFGDFSFALLTVHNAYFSGSPIDIGWPLGFLFVTYAVMERMASGSGLVLEAPEARVKPRKWLDSVRLGVPSLLAVAVSAIIFVSRFDERGTQWNIFLALALITVTLVVLRQFITLQENERLTRELRDLADRDPLTGLFNARYFHTELGRVINEGREFDGKAGLIVADIDDFKLFNDTYGHPKGDEVLKMVGDGLTAACHDGTFASRFGGDEFAVVLPGYGRRETVRAARRLRLWADDLFFREGSAQPIPIRLTFGFAVFPEQGAKHLELVAAADSSLYEAKRARSGLATKRKGEKKGKLRTPTKYSYLEALITAVDNKDRYTKQHCDLVSEYAAMIADGLGLAEPTRRSLIIAGALHDIGKICIPDRILRKPRDLTPEEYETIKLHVPLAAKLIQNVPRRKEVLDAVLHHHERFDGTGFAKGLKGTEIPLLGRIMAVADAVSAMTLDRPYRKALPLAHVLAELRQGMGTQFDPVIVEVFIRELERAQDASLDLAA